MPSPCENGGNCTDGVNEYICNCVTGYTGTDCETGKLLQIALLKECPFIYMDVCIFQIVNMVIYHVYQVVTVYTNDS